jgi:hypothetical protein
MGLKYKKYYYPYSAKQICIADLQVQKIDSNVAVYLVSTTEIPDARPGVNCRIYFLTLFYCHTYERQGMSFSNHSCPSSRRSSMGFDGSKMAVFP